MKSSFWLKGFYFERRVFFYNSTKLEDLCNFRGISKHFIFGFFLRLSLMENLSGRVSANNHHLGGVLKHPTVAELFVRTDARIILVNLLLTTFPVFLEYRAQQRSNIWKHFLMRSKRGVFLKISKPLGRRTRSRTFLRKNQTKRLVSEKPSRVKRATAGWF